MEDRMPLTTKNYHVITLCLSLVSYNVQATMRTNDALYLFAHQVNTYISTVEQIIEKSPQATQLRLHFALVRVSVKSPIVRWLSATFFDKHQHQCYDDAISVPDQFTVWLKQHQVYYAEPIN